MCDGSVTSLEATSKGWSKDSGQPHCGTHGNDQRSDLGGKKKTGRVEQRRRHDSCQLQQHPRIPTGATSKIRPRQATPSGSVGEQDPDHLRRSPDARDHDDYQHWLSRPDRKADDDGEHEPNAETQPEHLAQQSSGEVVDSRSSFFVAWVQPNDRLKQIDRVSK